MPYNRYYQYETSPRKLKPEYEPIKREFPKKSSAKRISRKEQARREKAIQRKAIGYIAICFIALFIISYRYSLIDDTYAVLKKKKSELEAIEKESTQIAANLESSLNLSTIEEEAKQKLGMQKLSTEQIIYVTLPKTDHVETSSDEIKSSDLEKNWIVKFIDKIIQNFKWKRIFILTMG